MGETWEAQCEFPRGEQPPWHLQNVGGCCPGLWHVPNESGAHSALMHTNLSRARSQSWQC